MKTDRGEANHQEQLRPCLYRPNCTLTFLEYTGILRLEIQRVTIDGLHTLDVVQESTICTRPAE